MAMGECSASTGGLKSQVCSLAYKLAATWRWPTLAQMNHSELSQMAGAVDDSTIVVLLLLLLFFTLGRYVPEGV